MSSSHPIPIYDSDDSVQWIEVIPDDIETVFLSDSDEEPVEVLPPGGDGPTDGIVGDAGGEPKIAQPVKPDIDIHMVEPQVLPNDYMPDAHVSDHLTDQPPTDEELHAAGLHAYATDSMDAPHGDVSSMPEVGGPSQPPLAASTPLHASDDSITIPSILALEESLEELSSLVAGSLTHVNEQLFSLHERVHDVQNDHLYLRGRVIETGQRMEHTERRIVDMVSLAMSARNEASQIRSAIGVMHHMISPVPPQSGHLVRPPSSTHPTSSVPSTSTVPPPSSTYPGFPPSSPYPSGSTRPAHYSLSSPRPPHV